MPLPSSAMVRIAGRELRPGLLPTLVVLMLLPLLLWLGAWQLERAAEKQQILDDHAGRGAAAPVVLSARSDDLEAMEFRPVVVRGHFDAAHQMLLDNRLRRGRAGYEAITPLRLADGSAVLVNRGWVPLGHSRAQVPEIAVPAGEITLRGVLRAPSGIYLPGWYDRQAEWPVVLDVDPQRVQQRTGYRVLPYLLMLDPDEPHGFERSWVLLEMGPERHLGYAVQWFGLALTLLILYVVLSLRRVAPREED